MGTKENQTVLMREEIILVQAANMKDVRRFHMEKGRQVRCSCLKLSLGLSNANEGSEPSVSICSLTGATTEAPLAEAWLAMGCEAPHPVYAACASAKCWVDL